MKWYEIVVSHFANVHYFHIKARNEQEAVDIVIDLMSDKTACKIMQVIEIA